LRASAFDIDEIYAVRPLSPSDLVLDWMPDTLVSLIEDGCDAPGDDNNLPATSSWSNNPSITLPLERYRRDAQRHERVAVSLVLGQACHLAVSQDGSVFKRSPAPSPSSRRGLEASSEYIDVAGDAITARSEADPDDHDYQSLLRTYSLERWFGSTMEKTQELAVELLQHAGAHAPQSMAVAHRQPYSRGTQPKGGEADRNSPSSSISLSQIECDPAVEANEDKDTGESIQAFTAAFKMLVSRLSLRSDPSNTLACFSHLPNKILTTILQVSGTPCQHPVPHTSARSPAEEEERR
jgi:hypothetical protein